ncbi:hypothetical protein [Ferruginibacter sp. HRS2-29]|uniref:hypothetical protein n=1 Tax=Ferruginibacter sp. HRS2-29 TaxID=2487334 RepID=UPI0020CE39FC|nr:hypothetical protein [Ferruginibacter sp. HRS2-29]MCP9749673.1 hypothetical protein [Ferruginibacter sp. HRS2-29]
MSSKISADKAKVYINNYRQGLPPGALKSAWLDRDFIDAILALEQTHQLDGVRVYMARYSEDDPQGRFSANTDTVIIVPTEAETDIEDAYFNYSKICPPYCNHDVGD